MIAMVAMLLAQVPTVDGAPDAGRAVIDVARGRLVQQDGGLVGVTDGVWLSTDELVRVARRQRELREQNAYLEAHASDAPMRWILGAALLGVATGAASVVGLECHYGTCFGLRRR